MKKAMRSFWTSLCVAYMALLPQFYMVFTQENRYSLGWTLASYGVILLALAVCGAVIFLVWLGVETAGNRWPRLRPFLSVCMGGAGFALFFRMIFSLLDKGGVLSGMWQAVVGHVGVRLAFYVAPIALLAMWPKPGGAVLRVGRVILTVLLGWFLIVPWTWSTYGWNDTEIATPEGAELSGKGSGGIYLFVMDEWSYSRTFCEDQLEKMPHLRAFLEQADLFTRAQSCGSVTLVSLPRFLYSPDAEMRSLSYDDIRKLVEHNGFSEQTYESIFDLDTNRYAAVLGNYLHYPSIIGKRVDYCGRFTTFGDWPRHRERFLELLTSQISFLRHFGVPLPQRPGYQQFDLDMASVQQNTDRRVADLLSTLPPRSIAFFHLCFPHAPYQYNPDGTAREPAILAEADYGNLDGYRDNLGYTDGVIGRIVEGLRKRGDYEESLVVFLSDHTWRYDPDEPPRPTAYADCEADDRLAESRMRHVPLLVKRPGQREGRVMEASVSLWDLHRLMRACLAGKETDGLAWWQGTTAD